MKKIIFVGIMIFYVGIIPVCGEETLDSTITGVTVYMNQASITREASLTVEAGQQTLLFHLSAYYIDSDSIQAKVYGEGEMLGVQYKVIHLREYPQDKVKQLEKEIRALEDQKEARVRDKDVSGKKEEFLDGIIAFSSVQIPKDVQTTFPTVTQLKETLGFLQNEYTSISTETYTLDHTIRDLNEKIEVLRKELQTLKRPADKEMKVIEVLFDSTKQQQIKVEMKYMVSGASWKPVYAVHIPQTLQDISLMLSSSLRQKTGEDWEKTQVAISTVVPHYRAGLPSLSSWILDIRRPVIRTYTKHERAKMLMETDEALGGFDKEQPLVAAQAPAEQKVAQEAELPFSFEYAITDPLTIPSQDQDTMVALYKKNLEGTFFYYAIPQLDRNTYFVGRIKQSEALLPGTMHVYFDDRFLGKTFLPEKKAGEEFDINLGVDRDVQVVREKINDKVKETMLFGKVDSLTITRDVTFKTTVDNQKSKAVAINVYDRIPVSRTDKIGVKNIQLQPEPQEKNYRDQEGVMKWSLTVPPSTSKEITISFTVTYPKDSPPQGL